MVAFRAQFYGSAFFDSFEYLGGTGYEIQHALQLAAIELFPHSVGFVDEKGV